MAQCESTGGNRSTRWDFWRFAKYREDRYHVTHKPLVGSSTLPRATTFQDRRFAVHRVFTGLGAQQLRNLVDKPAMLTDLFLLSLIALVDGHEPYLHDGLVCRLVLWRSPFHG